MSLFEKCYIGKMEVSNHFVRSATYEGKATDDGRPTEAICELYQRLAQGGVGTIITSYTNITDYESSAKNQLGIYKDDMIDDYRQVVQAVHQCGSRIVMQIVHGSSLRQADREHAKILGPSAIAHPESGIVPLEMTKEDIQDVVNLFAQAAKRVQQAGFDGVQIHCAHGYLLSQFISPLFNHRQDEYGGCVENRVRIVCEVYQAIRKAVGKDYPIWIKMNSSDEQEGGLTQEDFLKMAILLDHMGIDAIEVSGNAWKKHGILERAYYQDAAKKLANQVQTTVILTGGIREWTDMKPIDQTSHVHFFGFSRPLMNDPNYLQTLKKSL